MDRVIDKNPGGDDESPGRLVLARHVRRAGKLYRALVICVERRPACARLWPNYAPTPPNPAAAPRWSHIERDHILRISANAVE